MWLRTLAGAYAGQIREYGTATGLAALRTGMAERVESGDRHAQPSVPATQTVDAVHPPQSEVKKWQAPRRSTPSGKATSSSSEPRPASRSTASPGRARRDA